MDSCGRIRAPFSGAEASLLRAGDQVLLSGVVYTARDAAHKRMVEALRGGSPLAVDLRGAVLFYAGPSPARPGNLVGSVGPTTSYRMDPYTPELLDAGLKGMIGKGERSDAVVASIIKNGAVYFGAAGGIAALLARTVTSSRVLDYEDLGPEALRELVVRDMPLVVLIDSLGGDMYREGTARYRRKG